MKTSSWSFPNIFNVSQNTVAVLSDEASIVNRSRLLMLTEPTEIYNEPNQGVGLKRYLWQYNGENQKAMIKDRIVDQLRIHEPQCNSENTQFADGNLFTGSFTDDSLQNYNSLEMTVAIETRFGAVVDINLSNLVEN